MPIRRHPSLSDHRLRALLKRLRENPAAPQDFRARVLERLADDGMLASAAASKPAWRVRLSAWLRPAAVGLAGCGALALALFLRPAKAPVTAPIPVPAVVAVQPSLHPASQGTVARRTPAHRVPAAQPPVPVSDAPAQDLALQPVVSQESSAVGAAAQPKAPTLVQVAGTTETGQVDSGSGKTFPTAESEVRNNVVRVSQGGYADVHFSFKTTGHVRVDILDRLGRMVAVLYDAPLAAGEYDGNGAALACNWCLWNNQTQQGATAASGIYLLRIQTPDYVHIHKLMLIK